MTLEKLLHFVSYFYQHWHVDRIKLALNFLEIDCHTLLSYSLFGKWICTNPASFVGSFCVVLEKLVIYLFVVLLTLAYTSYKSEPCVFQISFVLHPQHYQMVPYRHQVDISTTLMPSTPVTPVFTCWEWQLRLAKLMVSGVVICPRVKVRQLIGEFCHPDTVFCSLVMFFSCLPISVG